MNIENEITVEVNISLNELIKLVENNGFKLKKKTNMNDIYMLNKSDKNNDFLFMLNKCILLRSIKEQDNEFNMITYKYKEYNENKEIIKQTKTNCIVEDIKQAQILFEQLDYEKLIEIDDQMLIYANDTDEIAIQNVNNKHLYIEIEDDCHYANRHYKSLDEMKEVISKYKIPIKNNNYFAKKAEVELIETYNEGM